MSLQISGWHIFIIGLIKILIPAWHILSELHVRPAKAYNLKNSKFASTTLNPNYRKSSFCYKSLPLLVSLF